MDNSTYLTGAALVLFVYATYGLVWSRKLPRSSMSIGKEKPGETAPRRNINSKEIVTSVNDNITTLYELMKETSDKYKDRKAVGARRLIKNHVEEKEVVVHGADGEEKTEKKTWVTPELSEYEWKTYGEFYEIITSIGSALVSEEVGLEAGKSKFGIFCNTCQEWLAIAHGCFTQSIEVVTVYANLGEEGLKHAVNEGQLSHLFCNAEMLPLITRVAASCPCVKYVIYVDKPVDGDVPKLRTTIKVSSFDEFVEIGRNNPAKPVPPKPSDVSFIMYTSGTTGAPKGVVMTHANVIGAIAGLLISLKALPNDVYIAYLPLAHILELAAESFVLCNGLPIGYGNPRSLSDTAVKNCKGDIRELRPTLMAGVPAVWERIRKGALAKIENGSFIKKWVFKAAYAYASRIVENGHSTPLLNATIFKPFHENLGGRMRGMLSGGAPISSVSHKFLRTCFGIPVIQGYGLTESCGVACVMDLSDYHKERVGPPMSSVEVKLIDVPDMKYFSTDKPNPRGEILLRGTNICLNGYYKNEEKTKEDFKDGWFHTGDVGQINSDGTFSVIDRKKNLCKLSHGEYIALEKLESTYKESKLVDNIMVYGDSERDYPVAVVVPTRSELTSWASSKGLNSNNFEAICKNAQAQKYVLGNLNDIGKRQGLKSYESVQKVLLVPDEWTPENDLVTAAQKIKRQPITEKYKKEIDALYK